MKKIMVTLIALVAVLVISFQVKTAHPTTELSQTEQRLEAKRLGTSSPKKWTAHRHVKGEALHVNHPDMRTITTTKMKFI